MINAHWDCWPRLVVEHLENKLVGLVRRMLDNDHSSRSCEEVRSCCRRLLEERSVESIQ
jgi:hypothetical protein